MAEFKDKLTLIDTKYIHGSSYSIVLYRIDHANSYEFVTWLKDINSGSTSSGHYHKNISDAVLDFLARS